MKNKIDQMYDLSVDLYYEIADSPMLASGHPGVMGNSSNEKFNPNYGKIMGTIETLKQIANKIKENGVD